MCEWLASAEWCDVRLLCRGRVFSAHRAVLASVSAFLRKILLSCQDEISPTLIILPDFDLDAMFSVLYYIYNGEVAIPKSRLEPFLDIIVTLKIFIDKAFLGKMQDSVRGFDDAIEKLKASNNNLVEGPSYPVFKLTSMSNYTETVFLNIKKGLHYPILMQEATDGGDKREEPSDLGPYLENIQSLHGARQKRSLRDSFIEPYPRNGNVNGRSGSVPAILNGHYLCAASALLPNANGRPFDAYSLTSCTAATELMETLSPIHSAHKPSIAQMSQYQNGIMAHSIQKNINNNSTTEALGLDDKVARIKMSTLLDLTVTKTNANVLSALRLPSQPLCQNYARSRVKVPILSKITEFEEVYSKKSNVSVKRGISNHVMQSPWSPRLPISFKPFRRKNVNKKSETIIDVVNDSNNNIEEPSDEPQITEMQLNTNNTKNEHTNSLEDTKCNISGQVFPDVESLVAHSKGHTASPRFTCPECPKTFSQLRNFKYHMSVHRGTREFAATCSVCGKYFNDRGYLSSHMKIHRNRKEYKCHICPKSFNQRVAYNMHVRIHTGVKPHVCEQCGKAFSRKMLLKQHQRTHSGERPYACAHCDKRFADRSNMTLHLRLHTGVKPFSCSLCPKSFTKKHHLKSHLNFHTGAKPYSCPRCHLNFTQSSNMRTHLKKCKANLAN